MILTKSQEREVRKFANNGVSELRVNGIIVGGTNKQIVNIFVKKLKALLKEREKLTNEVANLAFANTVEDFSLYRQYVYDWLDVKENAWNVFCKGYKMEKIKQRYRIGKQIGKGKYGSVYKAYDKESKIYVALKILKLKIADRDQIGDLKRELRALKKLSYSKTKTVLGGDKSSYLEGCTKNISCLYDWYCIGKNKFIISMELIKGKTLFDYMTRKDDKGQRYYIDRRPSSEDKIIKGMAQGIKILQDARIVHMDLHPGNVLITKSGPKIIDFGMACSRGYLCWIVQYGLSWTKFGDSRPPEIVNETIKPSIKAYKAADIWMLGKLIEFSSTGQKDLYELLVEMMTRKNPEERPTIDEAIEQIYELQTYKKELIKTALKRGETSSDIWFAVKISSIRHKITFKESIEACCS